MLKLAFPDFVATGAMAFRERYFLATGLKVKVKFSTLYKTLLVTTVFVQSF